MKYNEHLDRARQISEKAAAEHRSLTEPEQQEYNEAMRKGREMRSGVVYAEGGDKRIAESSDAKFGQELRSDQSFADLPVAPLPDGIRADELSLTRMVKGMATGNWAEAEKRAVMTEGSDSLGGYNVPAPLSARVLDLAVANSVARKAGIRVFPMDSKTLTAAKVATNPTVEWLAEDSAISESNGTLAPVTFEAKQLAGIVRVSIPLLEDSGDPGFVERAMANAIRAELDRVVLEGSGSGAQPQGIFGTTSVGSTVAGTNGASLDYSMISGAYYDVLGNNYNPTAIIMHSRDMQSLDALVDTSGQPIQPYASYKALKALHTSAISTTRTQGTASGIASCAYVGDYSQCGIGMRTDLRIEAFRGESTAVSKLEVVLRIYLRADFQVLQPTAFNVISGLIAS